MTTFTSRIISKKGKGFTLIELLIVIAMFCVGTVVLLDMFSIGLFAGGENANTIIATALAKDKMESIRNTAYAAITDEAKAPVGGYASFQREVLVTTPQTGLKEVTVNVYWPERSGETMISLVTYAASI